MLYLVATPIGNLGDISRRAIEVLEKSDLVLCEDTRYSRNLLLHLKIRKPLISLHRFNERSRQDRIIQVLKEGQTVSVISDAGTPCVNDPGGRLVERCIEEDLPFTAVPGACSYIQALVLSGFDTRRFQCLGFLPRKKGEKANFLTSALDYAGTSIAFESPHRLIDTLRILGRVVPERQIAIAREMTKAFEECLRGTAASLLEHFGDRRVKGEIVLVIAAAPQKKGSKRYEEEDEEEDLEPEET